MDYYYLIFTIVIAIIGSGSIVGIIIQNRIQKLHKIEEKLREDRIKIYKNLLVPFIQIFSKSESEKAIKTVLSPEYRKTSFDVILIGSDNVVKAYSDMMQFLYLNEKNHLEGKRSEELTNGLMQRWGHLLLEIRKDFGNEKTQLNEKDMLKHLIRDIDKLNF